MHRAFSLAIVILCAAAKQGKWKLVKAALFAKLFAVDNGQPRPLPEKGSLEQLRKLATATGVDGAKLDATTPECQGWMTASHDALQPIGATTTPAFFVNGRFLSGMQDFGKLDHVIQDELAKATRRIADGVAPADFYQHEIVDKGARTVKGRFED